MKKILISLLLALPLSVMAHDEWHDINVETVEKTVNFDTAKDLVKTKGLKTLGTLNKEKLRNSEVTITGYTDKRGSQDYNDKLGLRRANAVFYVLDVPAKVVSKGESEAIQSDTKDMWTDRKAVVKVKTTEVTYLPVYLIGEDHTVAGPLNHLYYGTEGKWTNRGLTR